LITSTLWHRFMVLQPPEWLIKNTQKQLIDFVWGVKHWLRPGVLNLPRHERGQGLVDITSRLMTFRLLFVKKLLYSHMPWESLILCLLKQAGRLGYGRELFLLDLPKIDVSSLPLYLQSVINNSQALSLRRETSSLTTSMFLNEPIFYNPLFAAIPSSRTFVQHFIGSDFLSVHNLLDFQRDRWKSGCG